MSDLRLERISNFVDEISSVLKLVTLKLSIVGQQEDANVSIFSFMPSLFYIFSVKYAAKTKKLKLFLVNRFLPKAYQNIWYYLPTFCKVSDRLGQNCGCNPIAYKASQPQINK